MFDIKRANQKVVSAIPLIMRQINRYAPKPLQVQMLSLALNKFFQQECQKGELDFLATKTVVIEVTDYHLSFGISLVAQGLKVSVPAVQQDIVIKAKSADFIQMITNKVDPDTLFFRRRLVMLGDTELGLHCKNLLDSIGLARFPKPVLHSLNWLAAQQAEQHIN